MSQRLVAAYETPAGFLEAYDGEIVNGGLLVRGARPEGGGAECVVEVRIAGESVAEFFAHLGTVARFGVTVAFDEPPATLVALAGALRGEAPALSPEAAQPVAVEEPERHETLAERLAHLTVGQKIAQALSGDRETRLALFRDHNKILHAFVLRNPRVQLDEILFAAKLTTLSPDALKAISEHVEWGQNVSIATALVRNPRTPLPVALKLLPRLSSVDIRAIAKGGARDQVVFAARKLLSG